MPGKRWVGSAGNQPQQTMQVERTGQPKPLVADSIQSANQKLTRTKVTLDHRERRLGTTNLFCQRVPAEADATNELQLAFYLSFFQGKISVRNSHFCRGRGNKTGVLRILVALVHAEIGRELNETNSIYFVSDFVLLRPLVRSPRSGYRFFSTWFFKGCSGEGSQCPNRRWVYGSLHG